MRIHTISHNFESEMYDIELHGVTQDELIVLREFENYKIKPSTKQIITKHFLKELRDEVGLFNRKIDAIEKLIKGLQ